MLEARKMKVQILKMPNSVYRAYQPHESEPLRMPDRVYRAYLPCESERLLMLTERLHSRHEQTVAAIQRHERRYQLTLIVGFALALEVGLLTWMCLWTASVDAAPLACGVGLVSFLLVLAFNPWGRGKRSRMDLDARLNRDARALFEIVTLLRGWQDRLARSEGWGNLQYAEFRIRLSRFDIGTEQWAKIRGS